MEAATKLTFHYVKSPHFDEHPLHGVYGGVTPHGIAMAVFSERMPIPLELDATIEVDADNPELGRVVEGEKRGKEGYIRLVHGVYHMDLAFAQSLRHWLDDKIRAAGEMQDA